MHTVPGNATFPHHPFTHRGHRTMQVADYDVAACCNAPAGMQDGSDMGPNLRSWYSSRHKGKGEAGQCGVLEWPSSKPSIDAYACGMRLVLCAPCAVARTFFCCMWCNSCEVAMFDLSIVRSFCAWCYPLRECDKILPHKQGRLSVTPTPRARTVTCLTRLGPSDRR